VANNSPPNAVKAIVQLRNSFAHEFSHVWSPPMDGEVFQKVVEIVNHLLLVDLPSKGQLAE
jgi:hypothetical protein